MSDDFGLQRFVDAQNRSGVYDQALSELRAGRKQSHWMWFVFPQIAGLGRSEMAQRYAISGLPEAQAYLGHDLLGVRLSESTQTLLELPGSDPVAVFGSVDAQKLRSSMTLFARADPSREEFQHTLDRYFRGEADENTVRILGR